jgi:hypothetical protein
VPSIDPGLVAVVLIFGLPIVAILASHQQKMATVIHGRNQAQNPAGIEALRRELQELRNFVHQQAIVTDNLTQIVAKSGAAASGPPPDIRSQLAGTDTVGSR